MMYDYNVYLWLSDIISHVDNNKHCFPTANIIFALSVDWSRTSSNCDVVVVVCDWPVVPRGNGGLLRPDASTDHVRTVVLHSQVCR